MNFPVTISETVAYLLNTISDEDRLALKNMQRKDLIGLHFGFGMGIRNSFGLWSPASPIMRDPQATSGHPDDVSMQIIELMWERLQAGYPPAEDAAGA